MLPVSLGPKPSGFLSSSPPKTVKLVGAPGDAPGFSSTPRKRISFFLVAENLVGGTGNAPAFSCSRSRRISFFLAPENWYPYRESHPSLQTENLACSLLHHRD